MSNFQLLGISLRVISLPRSQMLNLYKVTKGKDKGISLLQRQEFIAIILQLLWFFYWESSILNKRYYSRSFCVSESMKFVSFITFIIFSSSSLSSSVEIMLHHLCLNAKINIQRTIKQGSLSSPCIENREAFVFHIKERKETMLNGVDLHLILVMDLLCLETTSRE